MNIMQKQIALVYISKASASQEQSSQANALLKTSTNSTSNNSNNDNNNMNENTRKPDYPTKKNREEHSTVIDTIVAKKTKNFATLYFENGFGLMSLAPAISFFLQSQTPTQQTSRYYCAATQVSP